jgi:hypothetical protein
MDPSSSKSNSEEPTSTLPCGIDHRVSADVSYVPRANRTSVHPIPAYNYVDSAKPNFTYAAKSVDDITVNGEFA